MRNLQIYPTRSTSFVGRAAALLAVAGLLGIGWQQWMALRGRRLSARSAQPLSEREQAWEGEGGPVAPGRASL